MSSSCRQALWPLVRVTQRLIFAPARRSSKEVCSIRKGTAHDYYGACRFVSSLQVRAHQLARNFLHAHIFTGGGENSLGACAVAFERRHRPAGEASLRSKRRDQKPCSKPKSCDPSILWRSATVQMRPPGAVPGRHAKNSSWDTARWPSGQPES